MEVVTATPQEDGRLIHVVEPGQSPWSIAIAYGTKIEEIARLNGLDPANPVIYTGQKLLIRTIETATPGPTGTATSLPPTRTPRPTSTHRPPTLTPTVTTTPSATIQPLIPRVDPFENTDTHVAGIIIIAICGVGLLTVITLSLRGK
jgi:LysM repeat protein